MGEVASPVWVSKQHIIGRYALGGVVFGCAFPLAAWAMDILLRHLPYHWSSLTHIHQINPIHYLVDLAPPILGLTFTALGIKQGYGARLTEQLHKANQWQKAAIKQLTLQQTELREANASLESMATTDGLTGVKNHRALHERLREEYDHALRYSTPLSVLMLDVDKFKQYNDDFGHPAGDTVLRQLARTLLETARPCDVVARYGGEEFAVLLPGADVEQVKTEAERFRHSIETAAWTQRAITVSIGAATLAPTTPHSDALVADADVALYRSKYRGRNCVTHASDPVDVETLDTEAARWYDDLLQKLLAAQAELLGSASEQVRETLFNAYDATIVSWSRILNLRDKETEGHSHRVTEMMVRLARDLNYNPCRLRRSGN